MRYSWGMRQAQSLQIVAHLNQIKPESRGNADGALILSTGQAELIEEINQFLGIDAGDFQLAMVPPGIVLCTLCIMLWCVVLRGELRAIGISIVAAAQIPRSGTTVVRNGSPWLRSRGVFAVCD